MSKWKVLDREYIIRRPWLTARRDKVELPDGRINEESEVLDYPACGNVIAITPEGLFIMEQQYRHGLEVNSIELPCGVMEKGEQPLEAAQRELLEETGYGNGEWS
ncbi:MAG: NUDIX hydrolase, partial [Parabacteroides sp.]|nr:NUDIX hydrolase [Parabacteroides sp.]